MYGRDRIIPVKPRSVSKTKRVIELLKIRLNELRDSLGDNAIPNSESPVSLRRLRDFDQTFP